ncbi:MAG: ribosome small subunit-dependent GTPase A [Proteobacteria bacterium]|nr:ribosome small subunit-dependent GTPase A [Pseudomonadota bacterium]
MTGRPASGSGNGLVVSAFRRHWRVHLDDGQALDCVQKGRSLQIACGDRVEARVEHDGGVIERVMDRTSLFYRSDAAHEKLIAANVDQVLGVVAPDVAIDEYLLNRCIVAAETQACRFVIVATKADLPGFDALGPRFAPYTALGYPVVQVSALHDVAPLLPWLHGRHSVLVGQSGMGKSTLVNALVPDAAARTGDVSEALGAGRHTTTSSALYRLPALDDAWIVDAPGVKSFALGHATPHAIEEAFVEFRPYLGHCRFRDCRHGAEPGCALVAAVEDGAVSPQRFELLREMVAESLHG